MRAKAGTIASHYPARSILVCSKPLRYYAFGEFRTPERLESTNHSVSAISDAFPRNLYAVRR